MHSAAAADDTAATLDQAAFDVLLARLSERCGVDFRRYRLTTVRRRVLNRMISVRARTLDDYLRLFNRDPDEAEQLLGRVTIKVSRFYRNRLTFDALREQVIPELAAECCGSELRLLSAGCGQGEEPYTLAMLLEDAGVPGTIDAVDIDPRALKTAAEGHYDAAALVELPLDLRERFVEALDEGFRIRESVRRRVAFSRFDLSALAPADNERARYDLICCRNVLIYFQREVQERTLQALTQRIRAQGFLCLGEAEWPAPALAAALQPLPHQTRLFRLLCTLEHP